MKKITTSEKKTDYYEIDPEIVRYYAGQYNLREHGKGMKLAACLEKTSLLLVNVRTYKDKQVEQIDTYIGAEGHVFLNVAHSVGLSERDTPFSYSSYMKLVEGIIGIMLEDFLKNIQKHPELGSRDQSE